MTVYIHNGQKDPDRRARAERGDIEGVTGQPVRFTAYAKTTTTLAVQMNEPFVVQTFEGEMEGKDGDFLAIGIHGEMYPIDAAVMEASYRPVGEQVPEPSLEDKLKAIAEMISPTSRSAELITVRTLVETALIIIAARY